MIKASVDLAARALEAASAVRAVIPELPAIAVVLGSGLNSLVEGLAGSVTIPYAKVPHFPVPTVAGHAGNVVVGKLDGAGVLMLQGRFHYYEGHPLHVVTFPVRVLQFLGVR
ncbi:MAG TPA: purine-nucleoside phosphorylase, partial [Isosphaeraceae bacterium]|nr:purine-nucleoside phosphorylase [Isosphaeraceae bacterium]